MRIIVEHFGPIVHADIEVKPLTLLIGREATGKSTLAKLVYFGQAIPKWIAEDMKNELLLALERGVIDVALNKIMGEILKSITERFGRYFGVNSFVKGRTKITYLYDNEITFAIESDPNPKYLVGWTQSSKALYGLPSEVVQEVKAMYGSQSISTGVDLKSYDLLKKIELTTSAVTRKFFNQPVDYSYFPEGRALIEVFRQGTPTLFFKFISEFNSSNLSENFEGYILDQYLLKVDELRNYGAANQIDMKKVLHGEYFQNDGNEYLEIKGQLIPLRLLSSGQRDTIRLVMDCHKVNHDLAKNQNYTTFRVIEEPESHNYPGTLVQLLDLINATKGDRARYILTTHSELTIKYLQHAITTGNVDDYEVYLMGTDGITKNILNKKTNLIDANRNLFAASFKLNDQLFQDYADQLNQKANNGK